MGKAVAVEYLNTVCTALSAAITNVGALNFDATGQTVKTLTHTYLVEGLALFGDAAFPNWHPKTARNVRRSAIHDRLAAKGASFSATSGTEYPEWFAGPGGDTHQTHGWHRDESFPHQAEEHRAIREAVGMIDMSLMANILVQGRDAETVLNTLSANDVSVAEGHRAGSRALRPVVESAIDLGIDSLAVYAFSTENWSRDVDEVAALMEIFGETIDRELEDLAVVVEQVVVMAAERVVDLGEDRPPLHPVEEQLVEGQEQRDRELREPALLV